MSFFIAQLIIACIACLFTVVASIVLLAPEKFLKKRNVDKIAVDVIACYIGTSMVVVLSGMLYYLFTHQIIGLILSTWGPFVNGVFKLVHAYITGKVPKEEIITPWILFFVMFILLLLASGVLSF